MPKPNRYMIPYQWTCSGPKRKAMVSMSLSRSMGIRAVDEAPIVPQRTGEMRGCAPACRPGFRSKQPGQVGQFVVVDLALRARKMPCDQLRHGRHGLRHRLFRFAGAQPLLHQLAYAAPLLRGDATIKAAVG